VRIKLKVCSGDFLSLSFFDGFILWKVSTPPRIKASTTSHISDFS